MAVRSSMADLIAAVSTLCYDAANATLTTQQVQDALDRHRRNERYLALSVQPTQVGTAYSYLVYEAPIGNWEADATLWDSAYNALTTGVTADYLTGRWTFAASQAPPVYLVGQTYDTYAAAADLCLLRAALTSDQYNYSDQGQTLNRAAVPVNWRLLAADYRAMRRSFAA